MTRILAAVLTLACVSACEPAKAQSRPKHHTVGVPITITGVGTVWISARPPRRR